MGVVNRGGRGTSRFAQPVRSHVLSLGPVGLLGVLAIAASACGTSSAAAQPDARSGAIICASRADRAVITRVSHDRDLEAAWARYAATGSGWVTGDSIYSYRVRGLGVLNTLSDSFLHTMEVSTKPHIVHNLFVVRNRRGFTTVTRGSREKPTALVAAKVGRFYLGFGGIVTGRRFQQFYEEERWWGPGSFDFTFVKNVVATFALPSLRLESLHTVSGAHPKIRWGSSVERFGRWTYVYGTAIGRLGVGPGYVARVAGPSLDVPWEFWDGKDWSKSSGGARPIVGAAQTQFDVTRHDGIYLLVTSVPYPPFSPDARVYFGCSPTGPFSSRHSQRFTLSEYVGPIGKSHWGGRWGENSVYVYDALTQPALSDAGRLIISYDENAIQFPAIFENPAIYRPGYLDVTIGFGPS